MKIMAFEGTDLLPKENVTTQFSLWHVTYHENNLAFKFVGFWFMLALFVMIGTFGNLLLLYVFIWRWSIKSTFTFYSTVQASFNLFKCVVLAPLFFHATQLNVLRQTVTNASCKFYRSSAVFFILGSAFLLVLSAIGRYQQVRYSWKIHFTPKVLVQCLGTMAVASIVSLPAYALYEHRSSMVHVDHVDLNDAQCVLKPEFSESLLAKTFINTLIAMCSASLVVVITLYVLVCSHLKRKPPSKRGSYKPSHKQTLTASMSHSSLNDAIKESVSNRFLGIHWNEQFVLPHLPADFVKDVAENDNVAGDSSSSKKGPEHAGELTKDTAVLPDSKAQDNVPNSSDMESMCEDSTDSYHRVPAFRLLRDIDYEPEESIADICDIPDSNCKVSAFRLLRDIDYEPEESIADIYDIPDSNRKVSASRLLRDIYYEPEESVADICDIPLHFDAKEEEDSPLMDRDLADGQSKPQLAGSQSKQSDTCALSGFKTDSSSQEPEAKASLFSVLGMSENKVSKMPCVFRNMLFTASSSHHLDDQTESHSSMLNRLKKHVHFRNNSLSKTTAKAGKHNSHTFTQMLFGSQNSATDKPNPRHSNQTDESNSANSEGKDPVASTTTRGNLQRRTCRCSHTSSENPGLGLANTVRTELVSHRQNGRFNSKEKEGGIRNLVSRELAGRLNSTDSKEKEWDRKITTRETLFSWTRMIEPNSTNTNSEEGQDPATTCTNVEYSVLSQRRISSPNNVHSEVKHIPVSIPRSRSVELDLKQTLCHRAKGVYDTKPPLDKSRQHNGQCYVSQQIGSVITEMSDITKDGFRTGEPATKMKTGILMERALKGEEPNEMKVMTETSQIAQPHPFLNFSPNNTTDDQPSSAVDRKDSHQHRGSFPFRDFTSASLERLHRSFMRPAVGSLGTLYDTDPEKRTLQVPPRQSIATVKSNGDQQSRLYSKTWRYSLGYHQESRGIMSFSRSALMFFVETVSFLVSYVSVILVFASEIFHYNFSMEEDNFIFYQAFHVLFFTNDAVYPIVLAFFNVSFRREVFDSLAGMKIKLSRLNPRSEDTGKSEDSDER